MNVIETIIEQSIVYTYYTFSFFVLRRERDREEEEGTKETEGDRQKEKDGGKEIMRRVGKKTDRK